MDLSFRISALCIEDKQLKAKYYEKGIFLYWLQGTFTIYFKDTIINQHRIGEFFFISLNSQKV